MHVEVVYSSGQKYEQSIPPGTTRISRTKNGKSVHVYFRGNKPEKASGTFTILCADAERVGHALLLACSAEEVEPIVFPIGQNKK